MNPPDFIQIPRPVLINKTIQPSDKFLFGYIYWMTKLKLEKCVASNETLGKMSGLKPASVANSLTRLEDAGLLTIERTGARKEFRRTIHCLVNYTATIPQTVSEPSLYSESSSPVTTTVRNKKREEEIENIKEIFEKITAILKQPAARLLPGRLAKLKTRLKTFKPDEVLSAARGLAASAWMMGENDNNKKYATIDYLVRNDENVEKWIGQEGSKPKEVIF